MVLQLTNWTSTDSYVNIVKTNTVLDASSGKESFVVLRVKSDVNLVRIYGSTMSAGTAYPPFLWQGNPSSWGVDYTSGEWVTLIFKLTDIGSEHLHSLSIVDERSGWRQDGYNF